LGHEHKAGLTRGGGLWFPGFESRLARYFFLQIRRLMCGAVMVTTIRQVVVGSPTVVAGAVVAGAPRVVAGGWELPGGPRVVGVGP